MNATHLRNTLVVLLAVISLKYSAQAENPSGHISIETLKGERIWVSPTPVAHRADTPIVAKVWFDKQLLGDGKAYLRRAREFKSSGRRSLRMQAIAALKQASEESHKAAATALAKLVETGKIENLTKHWIVNGFTCTTTLEEIKLLEEVPGVKKIFLEKPRMARVPDKSPETPSIPERNGEDRYDPNVYHYPWYARSLMADKVWREFGITGKGTLNIIQDQNFYLPGNLANNVYRNPGETPGNGKDDDGNGLVDDIYGYDFVRNTGHLNPREGMSISPQTLHGTMCATIICGAGTPESKYQFGIAPEASWAGLISGAHIEPAVEWAILQGADTYSMSFSIPNLGEMRSHWRKVMEHGSFCGVYFVSGAGNFAQSQPTPVQMRTPEDIPEVVFAAAGVKRDFSRTPFSSKGPVEWKTEHYQDGLVRKPEVCAFNHGIPVLMPDGSVRPTGLNGNSFAGPMFCGTIALMLSADPDLLPWDLKEIITSTASDVGPEGIDFETGHGLINCYRAVKETLRRKAVREGKSAETFTGRLDGDTLDLDAEAKALGGTRMAFGAVQSGGAADRGGIKPGDVLISINGTPITTIAELAPAIRSAGTSPSKFIIKREGKELEVEVPTGRAGIGRMNEVYDAETFLPPPAK